MFEEAVSTKVTVIKVQRMSSCQQGGVVGQLLPGLFGAKAREREPSVTDRQENDDGKREKPGKRGSRWACLS